MEPMFWATLLGPLLPAVLAGLVGVFAQKRWDVFRLRADNKRLREISDSSEFLRRAALMVARARHAPLEDRYEVLKHDVQRMWPNDWEQALEEIEFAAGEDVASWPRKG